MKRISLLFAFTLIFPSINAEQISESQAASIASKYMQQQPTKTLKALKMANGNDNNAEYYIFNAGNDKGFVIVSGDDELTELVAYSDQGSFVYNAETPENIKKWLNDYSEYVNLFREGKAKAQYQELRKGNVVVAPMITTQWDQGDPYNELCPTEGYYKCPTGCAATALAQVMNYWEWPVQGRGSHSYVETANRSHFVDFSKSIYDWANMRDTYKNSEWNTAEKNAVSKLMYDCGVAINMEYSAQGSGALEHDIKTAAPEYFQYDTRHYPRNSYTTVQFLNILKKELDQKHPALFGGIGDGGGHEFICDGYDSNDFLHINWGWAGISDGYFNVNYMNPDAIGTGGGSGGFYRDQSILIITPNKTNNANTTDNYLSIVPAGYIQGYEGYIQATTTSAQKGESMHFALSGLWNAGGTDYSGEVGLAIFDAEGNRLSTPVSTQNISLKATNVVTSSSYFIIKSEFNELKDGIYYIFAVSKESRSDIESQWVRLNSLAHETIKVTGNEIQARVTPKLELLVEGPISVSNANPKPGEKIQFTTNIYNPTMESAQGKLNFEIRHVETNQRKMRLSKTINLYGTSSISIETNATISGTFKAGEKYAFILTPTFTSNSLDFTLVTNESYNCEFTIADPAGVEDVIADADVTVYPNPATNNVFIETEANLISASLFSADGRLVQQVNANDIDLTDCNAGYYIVSIETENGIVNKQIIKK